MCSKIKLSKYILVWYICLYYSKVELSFTTLNYCQVSFLQLVGHMSLAVTLVLSVCLKPGIVMERQTVWMIVMNSSVRCPAALLRCPAKVETSV